MSWKKIVCGLAIASTQTINIATSTLMFMPGAFGLSPEETDDFYNKLAWINLVGSFTNIIANMGSIMALNNKAVPIVAPQNPLNTATILVGDGILRPLLLAGRTIFNQPLAKNLLSAANTLIGMRTSYAVAKNIDMSETLLVDLAKAEEGDAIPVPQEKWQGLSEQLVIKAPSEHVAVTGNDSPIVLNINSDGEGAAFQYRS